jgi:serine/threonine-protein kinase
MSKRLNIGEYLGDYRIVGFLGKGGMGAVYHAVHQKIGRPVAIKVLSDPAGGSSFKDRFFNEARVQSSLHHPNIATLFDFQESGDLLYIVMEFVDGDTLDSLIERRYFAVEDAITTFESICDAIAFIHNNDIVHRDIKPQNVKRTPEGKIKLLDFGIAKDSVSHGFTKVGGIIGTPHYLAPEQLKGVRASALSDIWALGILFYEMLTGTKPFKGNSIEQLYFQITTANFERPDKLNPAVGADVSAIVDKCLEVEPEKRYQTVNEIIADLAKAKKRYLPEDAQAAGAGFGFPGKKLFRRSVDGSTLGGSTVPGNENNVIAGPERTGVAFRSLAAVGAAVLGIFAIVVVAIWAMSGPAGDPAKPVNSAVVSVNMPSPQSNQIKPTRSPASMYSTDSAKSGNRPINGANARISVVVEVSEGSAEVIRNGASLGRTPVEIEGEENESVPLTLKREGFEDLNVSVDITMRKRVFTFSLKRKP